MLTSTIKRSESLGKSKFELKFSYLTRLFRWNWISIVLLGLSSNLLINIILDYKYQRSLVSFSLEEYINAVIASIILLGGTRLLTKKLDAKIPWSKGVSRRLLTQLVLHFLFIVTTLNVLVISTTYFVYGGFYEFGDLMVINVSVVSLVFFFTLIDTGICFFNNWKKSSNQPETVSINHQKPIQISLGKSHHLVGQENIDCAIGQSGLVVLVTKEGRRLPYSQSLDTLMTKLDSDRFFRANRQTILNHGVVSSLKPIDYGKIEVNLAVGNGHPDSIIVSRTRAAEFRRWLKDQTA